MIKITCITKVHQIIAPYEKLYITLNSIVLEYVYFPYKEGLPLPNEGEHILWSQTSKLIIKAVFCSVLETASLLRVSTVCLRGRAQPTMLSWDEVWGKSKYFGMCWGVWFSYPKRKSPCVSA